MNFVDKYKKIHMLFYYMGKIMSVAKKWCAGEIYSVWPGEKGRPRPQLSWALGRTAGVVRPGRMTCDVRWRAAGKEKVSKICTTADVTFHVAILLPGLSGKFLLLCPRLSVLTLCALDLHWILVREFKRFFSIFNRNVRI